MGNYLNVGNAGFAAIRKGLYVDKTGMIPFINQTLGTTDKLTCVSRPRRFGKSFAAKSDGRTPGGIPKREERRYCFRNTVENS